MKSSYQLTQINITVDNGDSRYLNNGSFIPVFQDALMGLACDRGIQGKQFQVLFYLLANVDENNKIEIMRTEIAKALHCDVSTVGRAIKLFVGMKILCATGNSHSYSLSPNILNPRLAYRGRPGRLMKDFLPEILQSDCKTPLIPSAIVIPKVLLDSAVDPRGDDMLIE